MEDMKKVFELSGIGYDDEKAEQLAGYMEEILRLNSSVNLTAITDRDEFIQKHYIDSLLCSGISEFAEADTVIDVGTGGGFPGVPLAVAFPEKKFTLIDSLGKRVKIVAETCAELGINNVDVIHGRAEDLARRGDMRERFDICVSRAVANMSTLAEYCLPFVRTGGSFIAYKGPECDEEISAAGKAIALLGGGEVRDERPDVKGVSFEHRLIVIHKKKNTPSKFPRRVGTPSKDPIR